MNALAVGSPLRITVAAVSASLLVFLAATAAVDSVNAAALNPKGSACLDNPETIDPDRLSQGNPGECDGDSSPGAKSAITSTFGIVAPDASIGSVVTFPPPAWTLASDGDVTDGALAAELTAKVTTGALNGPCNSGYTLSFDVVDATTRLPLDPSQVVTLGEQFEDKEHELFGEDGFDKMVDRVAGIEKILGIYDLAQFTPKV